MYMLINLVRLGVAVVISTCMLLFAFLLASLITCVSARADDYHLVNLNEVSLDYRNYGMVNPNGHEPMTYPDPPKEAINLEMKIDIFDWFYLDPTVESMTTDAQFRDIGLLLRLGVRITDYLEVGLIHHSQHQLDRRQQLGMDHFPESDALEVKLYLFRKSPSGRGSVF